MGHPFGDLIRSYLSQKADFNQRALAYRSNQDEAVLSKMLNGSRLANFNARKRVLSIIEALIDEDVLLYIEDADEILEVAGWARLSELREDDKAIINRLEIKPLPVAPKRPVNENNRILKNRISLGSKLLIILILGIVLIAALNMWPGLWEKDICQHERITCVGNGWCRAQLVESVVQDNVHYIYFGPEANLDEEYFVYFDDEFVNAEDVSNVVYNESKDQWQFTIGPEWVQAHPTWDNLLLWRVDFYCTK